MEQNVKMFDVTKSDNKVIYVKSDNQVEFNQYDNDGNIACKTIIANPSDMLAYQLRYVYKPSGEVETCFLYDGFKEEKNSNNKITDIMTSLYQEDKIYANDKAIEKIIFYDKEHKKEAVNIFKHRDNMFVDININFTDKTHKKDITANFIYHLYDYQLDFGLLMPKMNTDKVILKALTVTENDDTTCHKRKYLSLNDKNNVKMSDLLKVDSVSNLKDFIHDGFDDDDDSRLVIDVDALINELEIEEEHVTDSNDEFVYTKLFYEPGNKVIKTIISLKVSEVKSDSGLYTKTSYKEITTLL